MSNKILITLFFLKESLPPCQKSSWPQRLPGNTVHIQAVAQWPCGVCSDSRLGSMVHLCLALGREANRIRAASRAVLAKIRPEVNSCGLKIPEQQKSFFEKWNNLFLAKHCFFFRGWEEKECGKSFGNLARPLGHGLCVTKHIFDELSVNQPKTDRLSFPCWLPTAVEWVPLLNTLRICLTLSFSKACQKAQSTRGQNGVACPFLQDVCSLLGEREGKKNEQYQIKEFQLSVKGGPE